MFAVGRSSKWAAVRAAHLKNFPTCAACGGRDDLNVHHVIPYHLAPALELEPDNLLTLCEGPVVNDHLLWGHLRDWQSYNVNAVADAAWMLEKIRNRPLRSRGEQ